MIGNNLIKSQQDTIDCFWKWIRPFISRRNVYILASVYCHDKIAITGYDFSLSVWWKLNQKLFFYDTRNRNTTKQTSYLLKTLKFYIAIDNGYYIDNSNKMLIPYKHMSLDSSLDLELPCHGSANRVYGETRKIKTEISHMFTPWLNFYIEKKNKL